MIQEYKCPNCGGSVEFDWSSQNMKCPYCDAEFDTKSLKEMDEDLKREEGENDSASFSRSDKSWEEDGSRHYVCSSCGGEIIAENTEAALSCPWCGNPVVMKDQFKGILRPDLVIPFKMGEESAKKAFYNHLKGKKLIPSVFQSKEHIDEIKGLYVPVWVFDASVKSRISFPGIRTIHWSDSRYSYTRTQHYRLTREGSMRIEALPVDGSSKMPDSMMEPLGPWNLEEAVDFQTAYLSGFLADRYDVDAEESSKRVMERTKASIEKRLLATSGPYATGRIESSSITMTEGRERYVLLPIWLLRTEWEGKNWYFVMNAQSGKMVGDLPMDKKKRNKYFLISSLIGGTAGALLAALLQGVL